MKTVTTFLKRNIDDLTIQWHVLSAGAKPIIYVTMHKQKASINMLSRSKAPKIRQITVTDMREKPVDFGVNLRSCNNFANLGSVAKVFVSV